MIWPERAFYCDTHNGLLAYLTGTGDDWRTLIVVHLKDQVELARRSVDEIPKFFRLNAYLDSWQIAGQAVPSNRLMQVASFGNIPFGDPCHFAGVARGNVVYAQLTDGYYYTINGRKERNPFPNGTVLPWRQMDPLVWGEALEGGYQYRIVNGVRYQNTCEVEGILIGQVNGRTEGVLLATGQRFSLSDIEWKDPRLGFADGTWTACSWIDGGQMELVQFTLETLPPLTRPADPKIPVFVEPLKRSLALGQYKYYWNGNGAEWPDPPPWLPYDHVVCESSSEIIKANADGLGIVTGAEFAPYAALTNKLVAIKVSNDGGGVLGKDLNELIRQARPASIKFDVPLIIYIDKSNPSYEWPSEIRPWDVASWQMFAGVEESLTSVEDTCVNAIEFCLKKGQRFLAPAPMAFDRTWEWPTNALGNLQNLFARLAGAYPEIIAYTFFCWGREGAVDGRPIGGTRLHADEILPWHQAMRAASKTGAFRWPKPSDFAPPPHTDVPPVHTDVPPPEEKDMLLPDSTFNEYLDAAADIAMTFFPPMLWDQGREGLKQGARGIGDKIRRTDRNPTVLELVIGAWWRYEERGRINQMRVSDLAPMWNEQQEALVAACIAAQERLRR